MTTELKREEPHFQSGEAFPGIRSNVKGKNMVWTIYAEIIGFAEDSFQDRRDFFGFLFSRNEGVIPLAESQKLIKTVPYRAGLFFYLAGKSMTATERSYGIVFSPNGYPLNNFGEYHYRTL